MPKCGKKVFREFSFSVNIIEIGGLNLSNVFNERQVHRNKIDAVAFPCETKEAEVLDSVAHVQC